MKIVFPLSELTEAIEDAAGNLFEEEGGTLGETGLTLVGLNKDTQEMLFAVSPDALPGAVLVDMSPTVDDESAGSADDDA